jgi:hypothetical protein
MRCLRFANNRRRGEAKKPPSIHRGSPAKGRSLESTDQERLAKFAAEASAMGKTWAVIVDPDIAGPTMLHRVHPDQFVAEMSEVVRATAYSGGLGIAFVPLDPSGVSPIK